MKIAIYPGSFDPITLGHLDIIRRAALCFDKVYVCVMDNCNKKAHMFPAEKLFRGLLADYAREKDARIIVKGLRNATDFDQEYQMAAINRGIWADLETVFLPASIAYQHFSSTMVREMIRYGQPLEKYVPLPVAEELKHHLSN